MPDEIARMFYEENIFEINTDSFCSLCITFFS